MVRQLPFVIANVQNAMACVDVAASFIKLSEADDAGGQHQDEIHPCEWEKFAGLPLEQHRA
jgi:hypothetical protein